MIARTLFSILNVIVAIVAIVTFFALPQYAVYVLYGFVAWMVVGFVVLTSRWGSRPVGSSARGPGPASAAAGPVPPAPSAPVAAPGPVAFCIFCGADLAAGSGRCPSCHRAVRAI